jgi:flagellar biosynthesis/type III secretory pathway chaperone
MEHPWEHELTGLLNDLSVVQDELLEVLVAKRQFLLASDLAGMQSLQAREEEVVERLEACQRKRAELLERAARENLPSDSVRSLAARLPGGARNPVAHRVREAASRTRLLQHQSLTNWVIVQRTLLHLSQLLEIIATGGRSRPTYGNGVCAQSGGSLMDQAA